mgnify:CR=1 FL=1
METTKELALKKEVIELLRENRELKRENDTLKFKLKDVTAERDDLREILKKKDAEERARKEGNPVVAIIKDLEESGMNHEDAVSIAAAMVAAVMMGD